MKKITFPLIYTIAVTLYLSNIVIAQKMGLSINYTSYSNSFLSPFEKIGFAGMKANNFNIKAVRDFVNTFKTVENNRWFLAEDGRSTSTFTADGITTTVAYNNKGHRQYILRIYQENKLLPALRHMVKREYYDATITLVKEIETNKGSVIYVHMQDKDTWKIVRMANGEMKLVENIRKG